MSKKGLWLFLKKIQRRIKINEDIIYNIKDKFSDGSIYVQFWMLKMYLKFPKYYM